MTLRGQNLSDNWDTFFDFCAKRFEGASCGIEAIDKAILGLRGIIGIRGAPGTNKSTLSLQIAHHYAKNHGPVIFYDRENGINRLRLRMLAQVLTMSEVEIIRAILKEEEIPFELIKTLPFHVITKASIPELYEVVKEQVKKGKRPLLVIDSLQKLPMNMEDRRGSIDSWLIAIDEWKVEFQQDFRCLIISEKNYSNYYNPMLGGSKDSSEIEYTIEVFLDLRPHPENREIVICTVAKDRDGLQGAEVILKKTLSDPENPRSFCYKLEEYIEEPF
jgi:hypothetical protein